MTNGKGGGCQLPIKLFPCVIEQTLGEFGVTSSSLIRWDKTWEYYDAWSGGARKFLFWAQKVKFYEI